MRSIAMLGVLIGGLALGGCFSERSTEPEDSTACDGTTTPCAVEVRDNSFDPSTRRVTLGSTVRWTNEGNSPHTATGDGIDSGTLSSGASYEQTFASAGNFEYECIFHSGMTGRIIVEAD